MRWDLRGEEPYVQENLPHPSVHLVFEPNNTKIFGVMTGKFAYTLKGQGQVLGIKFKAGAFYPFVQRPVSEFTNATLEIRDVFGMDIQPLEDTLLALDDDLAMVQFAEDFLRDHLPEDDPNVRLIDQIIQCIIDSTNITKVDDIVEQMAIGKRSLQRLFNQYVGVSPKWVIQRYRLVQAADHLAQDEDFDWAKLAVELGYYDQAHFIKDFKLLVGKSPADYAKTIETE